MLDVLLGCVGLVLLPVLTVYFIAAGVMTDYVVVRKNERIYKSNPTQFALFTFAIVKALFKKKVKEPKLPHLVIMRKGVEFDAKNISDYKDICGFSTEHVVPMTYPYILMFPLQLALLVDDKFPFQAVGIVHLANDIKQFAPFKLDGKVDITVRFDEAIVPHAKGFCFKTISELHDSASSNLLWRCESTYLSRGKSRTAKGLYESKIKPEDLEGLGEVKTWSLSGNWSKQYAGVSGDYNPIHVNGTAAKFLGFKYGIVLHGMWTNGACVAQLMPPVATIGEGGAPAAEMYVEMKLPMYLPANPALTAKEDKAAAVGGGKKGAKLFEVAVNAKGIKGDVVPHVRGSCSWQ